MSYINLENKAETEGANYKTRDLLQDIDSNFQEARNTTDNEYTFEFNNSNLVSDILTITHGLNTNYPDPLIRRPDGTYEDALSIMQYQNSNQVTFNFGGDIESGTWIGKIIKK